MNQQPSLITTEEAAAISTQYGLTDLDAKWWRRQTYDRKFPSEGVRGKRRLLKEHVEGFVLSKVAHLRSLPPQV